MMILEISSLVARDKPESFFTRKLKIKILSSGIEM